MPKFNLPNSDNSERAQVFPLIYGKTNKTAGVFYNVSGICCVEDGEVEVSWSNGSIETFSFVAGDCFGFIQEVDIKITVSGKFHIV